MLRSHGAERIFDQLKIRAFSNPVPKAFPSHFLTKKILETGLVRFGVPFTRKHFNRTIIKFRANRTKILNGSV